MNPKRTACEGIGNWVNWAQNRIIWHPYFDLLFHLQCSYKTLLRRWANFSCSEINFTYNDVVHFVHIQMGDTHIDMQPANLASAAYEKCSFLIIVGSKHERILYKVNFMRTTPVCCDRRLCCWWVMVEVSRTIALYRFCSGFCSQSGE
jgi:hypothetical protein